MVNDDLKGFQVSSQYQLNEMKGMLDLSEPWLEFKTTAREICDHFLTLSAASLLADMKPSMFILNLSRSAENWRRFLTTAAKHYQQQPTLNYNTPLYAAIIANNHQVLQNIETALPINPVKNEEYDDNFYFSWVMLLLTINEKHSPGSTFNEKNISHLCQTQLNKFLEIDTTDYRSSLLKALLSMDDKTEEDFWIAFADGVFNYDMQVTKKVQSIATKVSQFIAHRFIWFEGLAWLTLARKKGFTVQSANYKYCPDEVFEPIEFQYQNDWLLIPMIEKE
ncbi:hypothetical protein [Aliikangiella maris]|uniref:Uncharacterized protein n=2 Tax=Aliikangiella maris TaxID=3162458 RepID=A0ABV2BSM0_9GAMM